jgi:hypothetical protein
MRIFKKKEEVTLSYSDFVLARLSMAKLLNENNELKKQLKNGENI